MLCSGCDVGHLIDLDDRGHGGGVDGLSSPFGLVPLDAHVDRLFVSRPVCLLVEPRVAVLALVRLQICVNVLVLLQLVRPRKALLAILTFVGLELVGSVHRDYVILVHFRGSLWFSAMLAREGLVRKVYVVRQGHLRFANFATVRTQLALCLSRVFLLHVVEHLDVGAPADGTDLFLVRMLVADVILVDLFDLKDLGAVATLVVPYTGVHLCNVFSVLVPRIEAHVVVLAARARIVVVLARILHVNVEALHLLVLVTASHAGRPSLLFVYVNVFAVLEKAALIYVNQNVLSWPKSGQRLRLD